MELDLPKLTCKASVLHEDRDLCALFVPVFLLHWSTAITSHTSRYCQATKIIAKLREYNSLCIIA